MAAPDSTSDPDALPREPTRPLTPYETSALAEVAASRSPSRNPIAAVAHVVGEPPRAPKKSPEDDLANALAGLAGRLVKKALGFLDSLAQRSTPASKAITLYRRDGALVPRTFQDIARVDLWEADEVARAEHVKAPVVAALVALAGGYGGRLTMLASLPLSLFLATRAVHAVAVTYGFDPNDPGERGFATRVLLASITPDGKPASTIDDGLTRAGAALRSLGALSGAYRLAALIASRVGGRRRGMPLARAAVWSALHAWSLHGVVATAEAAYRERFLARKGDQLLASRSLPS